MVWCKMRVLAGSFCSVGEGGGGSREGRAVTVIGHLQCRRYRSEGGGMRLSKAGVAMLMRGPTDRVCFMVRGGGWRPAWCGGVRRHGGEARLVQRKEKGKEKGAWVKGKKK
jgi:hypothetical protein